MRQAKRYIFKGNDIRRLSPGVRIWSETFRNRTVWEAAENGKMGGV